LPVSLLFYHTTYGTFLQCITVQTLIAEVNRDFPLTLYKAASSI
jgi:hypothetical protein